MRRAPSESLPADPSAHVLDAVMTCHVFIARTGVAARRPGPSGVVAMKQADPAGAFGAYQEPIESA